MYGIHLPDLETVMGANHGQGQGTGSKKGKQEGRKERKTRRTNLFCYFTESGQTEHC